MMNHGHVRRPGAKQRVSLTALLGVRNEALSKAIRIMDSRVYSGLQVSELASELGISVRQLERLFQRHLNMSPFRYYTKVRLGRATALLRETDMSVTDVAFACGFSSPGQFSNTYRKYLGTSPAQFRVVQLAPEPAAVVRSARSDCA
jgi:transcriptional regulator GlxA family with amidase domain